MHVGVTYVEVYGDCGHEVKDAVTIGDYVSVFNRVRWGHKGLHVTLCAKGPRVQCMLVWCSWRWRGVWRLLSRDMFATPTDLFFIRNKVVLSGPCTASKA